MLRSTVVELRDTRSRHHQQPADRDSPSPSCGRSMDAVTEADGLIAVPRSSRTSYSGLFKSFFDVIDPTALDRPACSDRRNRRHRTALAGSRVCDATALHLPARDRRSDVRLRGVSGLGGSDPCRAAGTDRACRERIRRTRRAVGALESGARPVRSRRDIRLDARRVRIRIANVEL